MLCENVKVTGVARNFVSGDFCICFISRNITWPSNSRSATELISLKGINYLNTFLRYKLRMRNGHVGVLIAWAVDVNRVYVWYECLKVTTGLGVRRRAEDLSYGHFNRHMWYTVTAGNNYQEPIHRLWRVVCEGHLSATNQCLFLDRDCLPSPPPPLPIPVSK